MSRRAKIGYLVGYKTANIWRVWFLRQDVTKYVRDAVFDENLTFKQRTV